MPKKKVLHANFFRKLLLLPPAILFALGAVYGWTSVNSRTSSNGLIGDFPVWSVYLVFAVVELCSIICIVYAILSMVKNKIVFDENAVTIYSITKKQVVPYKDILKIQIRRENVRGSLMASIMASRTIYNIATTSKTIELSSRDYSGLESTISSLGKVLEEIQTTNMQAEIQN